MNTAYEFEVEEFDFPAEFESAEELSRFRHLPARSRVSAPRPIAPRINAPRPRPRPLPPRRPNFPRPITGRRLYLYAPDSPAASEYVRWVQTMLNQALGLQLPVDGVLSVETRSAIRSFQEKNSLPVTGIVGPDTERALQSGGGQTPEPTPDPTAEEAEWQGEVSRSSRDYIKWVQQSLNRIMGLKLVVDGDLGSQTRSAIRSFQQKQGLKVDGIVGIQTETAIKAALGRSPQQSASTEEPCEVLDRFGFDSDRLQPNHQSQIADLARRIIASQRSIQPIRAIRIVGHTDPVGTAAYNLALGRRRAEQVGQSLRTAMELMQAGSSKSVVFNVESLGERYPVAKDPSRNRRVQICFSAFGPAACVIGPVTLLEAEVGTPSPPAATVTVPQFRPCCMLGLMNRPLSGANSNLLSPGSLGKHGTSSEKNGLIYSGKAGFLDFGHIREICDLTKLAYDQLSQGTPAKVILAEASPTGNIIVMGEAVMHKCPVNPLEVAQAMAYDVGLGHEIVSYSQPTPGGHNSSFSPEDLCSNYLGTVIAARALNAGGNFNDAVTKELDKLVKDLDGQSAAESRKAFDLINTRWVNWSDTLGTASFTNSYLMRRNFTRTPFKTGHSSDAPTPAYVVAPMKDLRSIYSYTHKEGGAANLRASQFGAEIAKIRTDARKKYLANYDQP